jgi:hypothetical protein
LLHETGHQVAAPLREELDLLLDPVGVRDAVAGAHAVFHLATRIPPSAVMGDPDAWRENDLLRRDVSRLLVDAALAGDTQTYVQPTFAFVGDVPPHLESALAAEAETARFAAAGQRGVALRLGRLGPPGASTFTLAVEDAGRALVLALGVPSGLYMVAREAVSDEFRQAFRSD